MYIGTLTFKTSSPLSSTSFHVLPTEKEPLLFSFALWMNPCPLVDSATVRREAARS